MPLIANTLRTLSAALVTAAILVAALVFGREILVPLALAVISCFVLVPLVRWLEQRSIPEWLSVATVVTVVTGILLAASIALSSQLLSLAADLPAYKTNVVEKVRTVVGGSISTGIVTRAIDAVESYQEMLEDELKLAPAKLPAATEPPPDPNTKVIVAKTKDQSNAIKWSELTILTAPLTQIALTFLFTLFLLLQYKDLRDRIVRVVGTDNMSETTAAMSDAGERLSDLFITQTILNASFGIFVGCVLLIIGVPNAPLWGVLTFVMRFVPYIGSYIAAIPPILLAMAVDPGWGKAIATLALFAIGEPIMGQVVEPFVLGKRAGLSPFAMVLSASFWTLLWGPIGLVLAAPLTLVLVVIGRYIPSLEFVTVLLGDEPPLSDQQEFYHFLLSGDAYAAADQLEEAKETMPLGEVGDTIVIPALKLAALDRRRGRLDQEAVKELEETVEEVLTTRLPAKASDDAHVLVIPARGAIDVLGARFAASALNESQPNSAKALTQASGLTALSNYSSLTSDEQPQTVAIVSVSGIPEKQLKHIASRAEKTFPGSRIILLDLTEGSAGIASGNQGCSRLTSFNRFSEFLASARAASNSSAQIPTVAAPAELLAVNQ
jgi:predicted PurR-regulated permease PerM